MKSNHLSYLVFVGLALLSLPGLAFNADTIGFFSFNDAPAGSSAVAHGQATNSVEGAAIAAATITREYTTYDATFLSSRPAKYIFESSRVGAAVIATEPQSVHLESGRRDLSEECKGSKLNFAEAGTELSRHHTTGWTVEYFMLMQPGETWYRYSHQNFLSCGYRDRADGVFRHMAMCLPFTKANEICIGFKTAEGSAPYDTKRTAYIPQSSVSLTNGVWHHVAFVERQVEGTTHFQCYIDKTLVTDCPLPTENISVEEMTSGGYFYLGRGSLTAAISCVRFSKRALDADDFMYAAEVPRIYAGEGAVAFYPFSSATPGASAVGTGTVINAVSPGRLSGNVTTNDNPDYGAYAVFSPDAPGKMVFDGLKGSAIYQNPGSLRVGAATSESDNATRGRGGELTLTQLGTEISYHHAKGHTIEYFWKLDGKHAKNWECSFAVNGGYLKTGSTATQQLRLYAPVNADTPTASICSLGYYGDKIGDNPCRVDVSFAPAPNNGLWHHVALVERVDEVTAEASIEVYYDYVLRGSYALGGTSVLTSNQDLIFFRNQTHGWISCLRVTDHSLNPNQFLYAFDRTPEWLEQKDMMAFYSFKDGEKGSDASTATLLNDVDPRVGLGKVKLSTTEGANARAYFDDDAPGTSIFGGEEWPLTPFATNPCSVSVTSDLAGNSATLGFTGYSSYLYKAHDTGFTIEYFFKFLDNQIMEWDPTFQVNAGYRTGTTNNWAFNVSLPYRNAGTAYLYGYGYSAVPGQQKLVNIPNVLWDGKWHHFAYVERPIVDTTVSPAKTNWEVTAWIDYHNYGGSYTISDIVDPANLNASLELQLCRNKSHRKFSCLKVTTRPLSVREFMRTRRWPGLVINFR